mmetsp:Transcript_60695/g.137214  ORF Transcript_60695/g.137214 Transcript_60695/m.137214 type:complete len:289 (-) Transcript_60695:183-1049(-)
MIVTKKRKLKRRERNHFRREQKAREITGDSAGAGSAGGSAETSLLVQPATADPTLSEADLGAVVEQLGFLPTNLIKVAARDASTGRPTACQLYPLTKPAPERRRKGGGKDLEPFPTMIWLTCPELKRRISALEDAGWVEKLEARLAEDGGAMQAMQAAHTAYGSERWGLLSEEHRALVGARGWTGPLRDVGIAGIRDTRRVKCLHTMYAHYLALLHTQDQDQDHCARAESAHGGLSVHPVGEWIRQLLGADEPGALAFKAQAPIAKPDKGAAKNPPEATQTKQTQQGT